MRELKSHLNKKVEASFEGILFAVYCVPITVLGRGDRVMNKIDRNFRTHVAFIQTYILKQQTNKQNEPKNLL